MSGKGPGDADLGNMGAFDFSALQGVLNVSSLGDLLSRGIG